MTRTPVLDARALAWRLVPATAALDTATSRTMAFVDDGLVDPGVGGPVPYNDGEIWTSTTDRSRLRRLHGFLFAADWRRAAPHLPQEDRERLSDRAGAVVTEWRRRFGSRSAAPEMAYHDETTAQRLMMLVAVQADVLLDGDARDLTASLADATADLLATDAFYAGPNNHGMFQDLALLAYAVLREGLPAQRREELVALGFRRLMAYLATAFTAEGVHIEHSPTYHVMVVRSIASTADLADALGASDVARSIRELVARAERYATHAITPRGVFPPVSDTQQIALRTDGNLDVFTGDAFRYAATRGEEGTAPVERAAIFAESGYAMFRSSWSDRQGLYVFFAAAYNGGYHKHSDELSVHVEVAGREVIREAGPNGYNYGDPFTQYGFSSFAHNSVVVDGRGLPRHDGRTDETWLEDHGSGPDHLAVMGVTTRFHGVRVERHVTAAGERLEDAAVVVRDVVTSAEEHEYTFLWHLGPDVEPVVHSDHVELFVAGEKVLEVSFETDELFDLRVHRGEEVPQPLGWTFPAMGRRVPSTTLTVTVYGAACELTTTFRAGSFRLVDRGVRPSGTQWRARTGSVPLTYLVDMPDEEPRALVVAFSAIGAPFDFTYNYRTTLDGLPVARLFVLDDFGDQGAYYYSRRRVPGPFVAVQALIRDTLDTLGLPASALYTVGSSKGGTAALLHGLAAGAGRVVVGAPQTRIGTFLKAAHPEVLRYMSGGTTTADVRWADGIMDTVLQDARPGSRVSVLVGEADHHYKGHVQPFVARARQRGLVVDDLVIPDAPHARIGAAFRQYLRSHLEWSLGGDILPHCLTVTGDGRLSLAVATQPSERIATRLFRGADVVESTTYAPGGAFEWTGLRPGAYRVRVYRRGPGPDQQSAFTTARVQLSR